jgi:PhnB protein
MNTNLYLMFQGTCREAFAFYAKTFGSRILMTMTYGEAPAGTPVPATAKDMVMHTAMPLGKLTLMGCDDASPNPQKPGGFQISLDSADEGEVKRLFAALSDGGTVRMPLQKTFWSPLFGMCSDKFGVGWMVSVTGPQPS